MSKKEGVQDPKEECSLRESIRKSIVLSMQSSSVRVVELSRGLTDAVLNGLDRTCRDRCPDECGDEQCEEGLEAWLEV